MASQHENNPQETSIPGLTIPTPSHQDAPREPGTPRSTKDLTKHCSEILNQMASEMVHCTAWGEKGFDHYLPFEVLEVDINAAVAALQQSGFVKKDDKKVPQFTNYPSSPSDIFTVNEKQRYQPLVAISGVLEGLTLTGERKASCTFIQEPDRFNPAETWRANFKIDGLLRLKESTMPSNVQSPTATVADLAVPLEYKTSRDEYRENRKQLLGTANYCMNDDPRRKHIYGLTIEDDTMAVWYFSRSHSAKSLDFKLAENCRAYIQVMLSLTFATQEELGYDSTIKRCFDPQLNRNCFVYKVDDHYYKTQKTIFDHRSLCITGRATRVWQVIEVASFNELQPLEGRDPVVLKDVWLDDGWMTEGEIRQAIFDDLEKIAEKLDKGTEPKGFVGMDHCSKDALRKCLRERDWARYFFTVVSESKGAASKDVAEAAKPDDTLFGGPIDPVKTSFLPQADPSQMTSSDPRNLVSRKEESLIRRYCPKWQSRIVFKEVWTASHDVPEQFEDVRKALLDCSFALQLMLLAGWVYRDISSENFYRSKDSNGKVQGILGDLYAKRFRPSDGKGSSDPKTVCTVRNADNVPCLDTDDATPCS